MTTRVHEVCRKCFAGLSERILNDHLAGDTDNVHVVVRRDNVTVITADTTLIYVVSAGCDLHE